MERAAARARKALDSIVHIPRNRTTLVIILAITAILAVVAFLYLILRRR